MKKTELGRSTATTEKLAFRKQEKYTEVVNYIHNRLFTQRRRRRRRKKGESTIFNRTLQTIHGSPVPQACQREKQNKHAREEKTRSKFNSNRKHGTLLGPESSIIAEKIIRV